MDGGTKNLEGFGGEKDEVSDLPFKVGDVADSAVDQVLLGFVCWEACTHSCIKDE